MVNNMNIDDYYELVDENNNTLAISDDEEEILNIMRELKNLGIHCIILFSRGEEKCDT